MENEHNDAAPKPIHPPDEAIAVVGSLLIMMGVAALLETLFSGFEVLNAGFLAIPVGYGILKGNSGCRATVLVLGGFILLVGVVFVVLFSLRDLAGWRIDQLQGPENWIEAFIAYGMLGAVVYMFLTLRRADVRRLFDSGERPVPNPRAFLISVTLVTTLMLSLAFGLARKTEQFVDDLYNFRVKVFLYDSETGDRINNISTRFPPSTAFPRDTIPEDFNRVQSSSIRDDDGSGLEVSGIASAPLIFQFGADGYETKAVKIDENTDETIRVELQPLPEEKQEKTPSEGN